MTEQCMRGKAIFQAFDNLSRYFPPTVYTGLKEALQYIGYALSDIEDLSDTIADLS